MTHRPDHLHIDLSRYVALGDSITSGYADGALYYTGQQNSYANLLAGQLKEAGGGDFVQPLLDRNSAGTDALGHPPLVLERRSGVLVLTRSPAKGDAQALQANKQKMEGPYHNLGVPGAKAITAVAPGFGNRENGPGNYNPFFARMASDPARASMLSDAVLAQPTFYTLFIGNNDALAYALCGGTENAMSASEGLAGDGFRESLAAITDALGAKGAKGVIASLPLAANLPYFNAIPYNGLLLTAEEAAELSQFHNHRFPFSEGKNPFLVHDSSAGLIRQAQPGELILLDLLLDQKKDDYLLARAAIPKKYTLSPSEAAAVETNIRTYNTIIKEAAEKKGLGFADVNLLVKSASPDRQYNPVTLSLDYRKKGVFSLDGLHPNAFGQALLANEFIRVLNSTFGTSIPPVKSHRYPGITFPPAE